MQNKYLCYVCARLGVHIGVRVCARVCECVCVRMCAHARLWVCACAHVRIVLLTRQPRELRLIYTRNTLTCVTFIFVCKSANVQVAGPHSRLQRLLYGRSNVPLLATQRGYAQAVQVCFGYRYSDWLGQQTTQIPDVRYLATINMFRHIRLNKTGSNVTVRGMDNTLPCIYN